MNTNTAINTETGRTDFTTQEVAVGGAGLSSGGIAGIVIFILLLILMGVVAVVVVVYLVWRRRGKESSRLHSKPSLLPTAENDRIMNASAIGDLILAMATYKLGLFI